MSPATSTTKRPPRKQANPDASADAAQVTLTKRAEPIALSAMWHYYKEHKAVLIDEISDHREAILADLMAGKPVDQVFAIYARPPEPPQPMTRKR
jgi:hypothetical protein